LNQDIFNFTEKGIDNIPFTEFTDTDYLHYSGESTMENRFVSCGWCKEHRLFNGISSADTWKNFSIKKGSWDITSLSSCNNGTIMIDKDLNNVVMTGHLKGGCDQGNEEE
jgi:hypothetical protein